MKRIKSILFCFSILMSFTVVTGCQTWEKSPDKGVDQRVAESLKKLPDEQVDQRVAESLVTTIEAGCETELKSFCSKVTPGQGRIISCLYAHNEKISGRCEYALYDVAAQLERFVARLSYLANECDNDIEQYCSTVIIGEGRLLKCLLEKNRDKISNRCSQAAKDVGLE